MHSSADHLIRLFEKEVSFPVNLPCSITKSCIDYWKFKILIDDYVRSYSVIRISNSDILRLKTDIFKIKWSKLPEIFIPPVVNQYTQLNNDIEVRRDLKVKQLSLFVSICDHRTLIPKSCKTSGKFSG